MATTATMMRLKSLVDSLAAKLHMSSWSPSISSSSSSSPSSYSLVKEEVEKLRRRMERVRALLKDAEEREIRESSIKLWLDELKDVAYDAEDVVEEFEYELLRYQLVCEEAESNPEERGKREGRVSDSHITPPCLALHDASFQEQIIKQIKEISNRFGEICKDKCGLKLRKNDGDEHKKPKVVQRPPTSSLLVDSHVYGRDEDKDEVVDMLLWSQYHEHGIENVSVVSIVGLGGIGKTTLAQIVYNDERVVNHFEVRSWVCVSDCLDVPRLTKEILETLTGETAGLQGFNQLQEKVHNKLEGKRFLLVLDDLWNESLGQWEALWRPLSNGAAGSKVLITTRNEEVSRIARAIRMHHLEGLLEDDCWSLFADCAFGWNNADDHPNLASIGKQIVDKCGGVPLAIRTLGGLLFNEADEDRWNDILKSDMWDLPEEKNDILPALRLSYHHLPLPIKPCFAFCAVFPKDHLFSMDELVLFWMAQGYVKPTARKSMEDVGREYLDELLQRSFFQECELFECFLIKMHDLIHDLALSVWREECATVDDGKLSNTSRRVRHLSFKCQEDMITLLSCGTLDKLQYLGTTHSPIKFLLSAFSLKVLDDMFQGMKYLRVLNLQGMSIRKLPDSIGNLRHLRFFGISGYGFYSLPESLGNLFNLQTLKILEAGELKELPKRLKDLVNLRHLDLYSSRLSMMPQGIGRLTQLRTLRGFVVGKGSCAAGLGELRQLNDLQGKLEIHVKSPNNWVNIESKILNNKKGLDILQLKFDDFENSCDDESGWASIQQQRQQQQELLELIQPHTNIKEINISGYIGNGLPNWVGDPSYSRLETLTLWTCKNCKDLPPLGQLPSLKFLEVSYMGAVRSVGSEFLGDGMVVDGAFPSLEVLSLLFLPELEGLLWIGTEEGGAFAHLSVLTIRGCPKVKCITLRHLTALRNLSVFGCDDLTTLNYYHVSISKSGSSSGVFPQEVVDHMHIPRVHTMNVKCCPKLSFPPAAQQQQLPSSLRHFAIVGSPLLIEWVRRHTDKLAGVPNLEIGGSNPPSRPHLMLRNVEDVEEAEAAGLSWTKGMEKLELQWDLNQHRFSSNMTEAEQVLKELSPPNFSPSNQLLQELVLEGYQGHSFPHWVGHPDYLPSLVKVTLSGCVHCEHLPTLGRLPSLRELHISYMYEVQHVGREFCGEKQRWIGYGAFPKLHILTIRHCPKLRTIQLPALLDSGGGLSPCSAGMVSSSGLSSSSISTHSLNPFPRFKVLSIEDCPDLVSLVGMHGIPSMQILILVCCPTLILTHEALLPPQLRYAIINGCPRLSEWWQGYWSSRLIRVLRVDGELVVSDGRSTAEMLNAMREIIQGE